MKYLIILAAGVLLPVIAVANQQPGQCDGSEMYNYVDVALQAGTGVLNVAKDPEYGGRAASIALNSRTMGMYRSMIFNIRELDLALARDGCKSLVNGPTKGMMSTLKQIDSKIIAMTRGQYSESGVLTNGLNLEK